MLFAALQLCAEDKYTVVTFLEQTGKAQAVLSGVNNVTVHVATEHKSASGAIWTCGRRSPGSEKLLHGLRNK